MKEIDQMLNQWFPVNTIIREQFRKVIVKAMYEHASNVLKTQGDTVKFNELCLSLQKK
tara:strand:+ start:534 stop:707 length:174 start_codon:yes stop_codon:yes gene_type:complete